MSHTLENISLGYACINETLKDVKPKKNAVCVNRSCIARTFRKNGKQHAIDLVKINLTAVIKILEWNASQSAPIKLYRLSSDMFPHITNPEFIPEGDEFAYSLEQFSEYFTRIGEVADKYGQRLTFHPGQYNQIGAKSSTVFQKTKKDLLAHAKVLDLCHRDSDSVMVVHGGGVYDNKLKTMTRWIEQFKTLPECVRDRIVIENCERAYNYKDMLFMSKEIKRPFVFDTHHHECYSRIQQNKGFSSLPDPGTFIDKVVETWTACGVKPKFHVSEQHPDKRIGAHSDYVETIPSYLFDVARRVDGGIDVMIEAKKKELAVQYLQRKYSV